MRIVLRHGRMVHPIPKPIADFLYVGISQTRTRINITETSREELLAAVVAVLA